MNCRDFMGSLLSYVRGEIAEPKFGEMVEHEATCPVCRGRVAEYPSAEALGAESSGAAAPGPEEFLASVIGRTSGADCDWVTLRMAEAMDESPGAGSGRPVRDHLASCRSCQRLRDQLNALPDYYEALPTLRSDRQFTEDVLARTVGPRPGFFEVLRAIWKTPGTLWESAVACALVAVALFGSFVPSFDTVSGSVRDAAQSAQVATVRWGMPESSEDPPSLVRRWSQSAFKAWEGIEDKAARVSEWSTQTAEDVRSRDFPGLLEDIRVVLEPLGLYPDADTKTDSETETETRSEVRSEAESGVEVDSDRPHRKPEERP